MSVLAEAVSRLRVVDSYAMEWGNLLRDADTDPQMVRDVVTVVRDRIRLDDFLQGLEIVMIEIRWVDAGGGNLQLQQRTRSPRVDGNGAFCDFTAWSDWVAVPIVHDPRHVASVVDVFPTR